MAVLTVCSFVLVASSMLGASGHGMRAPHHFYPYGPQTGDLMVERSDDGSAKVKLSHPFPYFGTVREEAWVSISRGVLIDDTFSRINSLPFASNYVF